ncbi:hypothetical protein MHYP_G00216780 [Metynnis hypsauchen]
MPKEKVQAHLPEEFGNFQDTQVILDCTELRCQTPSSLLLQSEVFSNYKSHCTFKALTGMAPHGAITFVSGLYAGSISDREMFRQSGIIPLLTPDMAIMVDTGFLVDDLVPCKIHRPVFLKRSMLPLMLILCLVESAGGSPMDNVFWQYANWTAKQYTNDSCYVCHLMPSSVDKHSITTAPQDLSATLQAVAHTCLSPDCLRVIHYEYPHINYSLSLSQDFCSKTRNTTDLAMCLQALQYFLTNRSPPGTPLAISAINKGPFSVCFEGFGHTLLGHLPDSLCPYTVTPCNGSSSSNCSALAPDDKGTTPSSYVTDWYWVCSYKVYVTLPENWGGRCAFTLFNSSLILISHNSLGGAHIARRNKRSSDDDFPPPEHQLKSKAAKFWECLFPQYGLTQVWNQLEVTHYRLATFTNATRMALQGVKDELTALRLTTMQNRMALDLLLAEEGGVCAMMGDSCCTYIPANDEDHGSIAVALDRMRQVSTQLQLDEHGVARCHAIRRASGLHGWVPPSGEFWRKPPPYEKEVKFEDIYPQLPVISQEGNYYIRDVDDRIIETGRAETTIKMYPSSKSKKKQRRFETKGVLRIRRMESGDEGDQSDCEIKGGYDPAVRRILARAEKRGDKTWRKEDSGDDSSDESENGDSDGDPESEGFSSRAFCLATSSTRMEEDRQRVVKEVERSIEQCLSYLDKSTGFESRRALENQLEGLQMQKKKLQKEGSKKFDMKYVLRSRKGRKSEKMCPVVIRGQSLEYKPWQNTDMSDILEKLPTLQDGAYPWISKLEEIMVGTQPAIGDIKRLLANLLGVPAMEEILQKAGLDRYVGTAVNDPELFSAIRGRM